MSEDQIEIYTWMNTPFRLGGVGNFIKTAVELGRLERVLLGKKQYGLIVRNVNQKCWHMVEELCGAIIGTNVSRMKLIDGVRADVKSGTIKQMKKQIAQGKKDCAKARMMENRDFFTRFRVGKPQQSELPMEHYKVRLDL